MSINQKVLRLADIAAHAAARVGHPITSYGQLNVAAREQTVSDLIRQHFETHSTTEHINYSSMVDTLELLGGRASTILETGSSAWGTNSSRLFDSYVATFGGEFWTVDARVAPMIGLRGGVSSLTKMVCNDSVRFLERWVRTNAKKRVDLVYLDSWDLNIEDPFPAAIHGLREFLAVQPLLKDGALLLIDDTPVDLSWFEGKRHDIAEAFQRKSGLIPGKGMLVDNILSGLTAVSKLHHRYQVLYRFD